MIYSAWYFCSMVKLSIVETRGMLGIVRAFEKRELNLADRNEKLLQLKEFDSLVQAYMIPALTESLLDSGILRKLKAISDSDGVKNYIRTVKDILTKLTPDRMLQSLVQMIQSMSEPDYKYVVKQVATYDSNRKARQEETCDYLETDRFADELLMLSILRCIAYENPGLVSALAVNGEEQIDLVRLALDGVYGQLCRNLAIEIQFLCDIPVYEVLRLFPEGWQERPDMVELAIPFLFPLSSPDHSMGSIFNEAWNFNEFDRRWKRQGRCRDVFWMDPKASEEERVYCCLILWQSVLWNVAMDRDERLCMDLLKESWDTPSYTNGKINKKVRLNRYQRLFIPKNVRIDRREWANKYICSPWQMRTEDSWNKGHGSKAKDESAKKSFHEFYGFEQNANGLKVFMAVCLMERILCKEDAEIDDFYIRLLLHMGDAFSCYGARNTFKQITAPPLDGIWVNAWNPIIKALGYYAWDLINSMGVGSLNAKIPDRIISLLRKKSPIARPGIQGSANVQLKYLFHFSAFFTAVHWAFEGFSMTGISKDGYKNAWLQNGDQSNASQLCRWIFSRTLRHTALNVREAVQLDYQAYGREFAGHMGMEYPFWYKNLKSGKYSQVRFNALLQCRNLTYEEWEQVGDITREVFGKDAYLIAHTLRVRAVIEYPEDGTGHEWIKEWQDVVWDISYRWEFSRMARYIMIQMLAVTPGCRENYIILVDLLKKIVMLIQEFSSLDSIYYLYHLSKKLADLRSELGDETEAELKGVNAVGLYQNMEKASQNSGDILQWEDLLYYYLMRVREDIYKVPNRSAGYQLKKLWKAEEAERNHIRIELVDEQDWNALSDKMWFPKNEKICVLRDSVESSFCHGSGECVSNQYQSDEESADEWRIGVIAKSNQGKDKSYYYTVCCGDVLKRNIRSRIKYLAGDIVAVKDGGRSQFVVKSLGWKPDSKVKVEVDFAISANELKIAVFGTSFEREFKECPEIFELWNGDIGELFSSHHNLRGKAVAEYVEYEAGKYGWIPYEKNFAQLMIEKMLSNNNPDRRCTLTFIKATGKKGKLLFSLRAGENYAIRSRDWQSGSWKCLEKELRSVGKQTGLRINVKLVNENGFPCLALDGAEPFDYRNICWREQFSEEQPFQIWYDGEKWVTKTAVQKIRSIIPVYVIKGIRDLEKDRKFYVQVTEDGWEEVNQRRGFPTVERLKSKVLDADRIPCEVFRSLIEIKVGDIFKLQKVRRKMHKRGYYSAELDAHMPVSCAAESVSFIENIRNNSFCQNRCCIVENVREMKIRDKEERTAEACNIPELDDRGVCYQGIVAEYTDSINLKEEFTDNLILKILVDVNGRMISLNVPLSAFSVKPLQLGDCVEAKYEDGGWIFRAKRRIVYVRALWKIEDHREQAEARIFGESLGVVNVPYVGTCMVTQDTNQPVLHLWSPESDFQDMFTRQCGVKPGNGTIKYIGYRFSNYRIFRWASEKDIVELQSEGRTVIGESEKGTFTNAKEGWSVQAGIYQLRCDGHGVLYDLRRYFIPVNTEIMQTEEFVERDEEYNLRYNEWVELGDPHTSGRLKKSLDVAEEIVLNELNLPEWNDEQRKKWIHIVPLEPNQRAWVQGRDYYLGDVRVFLKLKDGKWSASIRETKEMILDGKLIDHFDPEDGHTVQRDFYFAGKDEQERLRFEWGYGYSFVADEKDVTDFYGNTIARELFFGDCIKRFTFLKNSDGRWKAYIAMEDVHHEIEARVWQDTEAGIVQLLKVVKKDDSDHISIRKASVSIRKGRNYERQKDNWSFQSIFNVRIERKSEAVLSAQMEKGKEKIIFAYINTEICNRQSNYLEFSYIPLDRDHDKLSILNNKIICLTAGYIEEAVPHSSTRIVNDQKVQFFLPDELPDDCDDPHVVVSVTRRNFSFDESRLRVLFQENPRAYYGYCLLVTLNEVSDTDRKRWRGSVKDTLFRSVDNLKVWLRNKKLCHVTMGILKRKEQKLVCAEISPGIVFNLTEFYDGADDINGAIASLVLEKDRPRVEILLEGDIKYFSNVGRWKRDGRPVELLVMDGAANKYAQTAKVDDERAENIKKTIGSHFTVAGFPQIQLKSLELLDLLIRQKPPRLGIVYNRGRGTHDELCVACGDRILAGFLEIAPDTGRPVLNMVSPSVSEKVMEWQQISFKDGSVGEIVKHAQQGVWHYHDHFTAVYIEEEKKIHAQRLPDGKNYNEILVFTDEKYRLRYSVNAFDKYGMSAREIVENGLAGKKGWYPVAGQTDRSLWIEYFPGKIIEVPRSYLFAGKDKSKLEKLCVSSFTTGDEIELRDEEVLGTKPRKIMLTDFKFGARSAFGPGRAFLPVQNVLEDGLELGGGFWMMRYPVSEEKTVLYQETRRVVLNPDNELISDLSAVKLQEGDCVFLSLNEKKEYCIAGQEEIEVSLAFRYRWGENGWLYDLLRQNRKYTFDMFRNYLPVVITQKEQDGTKVYIAYRWQERLKMEDGMIFCCNCIGMFVSEEGERIIIRSGRNLFCIRAEELICGVPENERKKIVRELSARGTGFFMTRGNEGWKSGIDVQNTAEEINIEMLYPVEKARGILCRDRNTLALKWLPLSCTCRVEKVGIAQIWEVLQERRFRDARIMMDGTVSLIHESESDKRYRFWNMSGGKYRVVPKIEVARRVGYYAYLCELYPTGDILLLQSEYPQNCKQEEPVRIEILKKQFNSVIVVPQGERRTKINLSSWIVRAYRKAYHRDERDGKVDVCEFRSYIPERFNKYQETITRARQDANNGKIYVSISSDQDKINEALIYLSEIRRNSQKVSLRTLYLNIYKVVKEWILQTGEFLAVGFRKDVNETCHIKLDLLPTIEAIMLLNKIQFEKSDAGKTFAVHLTRMLGYACSNSQHQEALLDLWLLKEARRGIWRRLQRISLGGETTEDKMTGRETESKAVFDGVLSVKQYDALLEIASSIVERQLEDKDANIVAQSLLYAVGVERDYTNFYEYLGNTKFCCSMLAPLGRILTPKRGNCIALEEVPDVVLSLLEKAKNRMYIDNKPIELLTDIPIPIGEKEIEEVKEKCHELVRMLDMKIKKEGPSKRT